MTNQEIRDRLDGIALNAHDPERAHSLQDALYRDFVKDLSESADWYVSERAKMVLTVEEIEFERWCA